jgi:hypothetical protein
MHSGPPYGIVIAISSVNNTVQQQHGRISLWSVSTYSDAPDTHLDERDNSSAGALTAGRFLLTGWTTNLTAAR